MQNKDVACSVLTDTPIKLEKLGKNGRFSVLLRIRKNGMASSTQQFPYGS